MNSKKSVEYIIISFELPLWIKNKRIKIKLSGIIVNLTGLKNYPVVKSNTLHKISRMKHHRGYYCEIILVFYFYGLCFIRKFNLFPYRSSQWAKSHSNLLSFFSLFLKNLVFQLKAELFLEVCIKSCYFLCPIILYTWGWNWKCHQIEIYMGALNNFKLNVFLQGWTKCSYAGRTQHLSRSTLQIFKHSKGLRLSTVFSISKF